LKSYSKEPSPERMNAAREQQIVNARLAALSAVAQVYQGTGTDIHKRTVKEYVKKVGGKVRSSGRSRYLCYPSDARSIQRRIRADAVSCSDPFEDAYRSAREHARELQDKHTAQRLADVSTRSCQAEAS
jgi:hypothetical protein